MKRQKQQGFVLISMLIALVLLLIFMAIIAENLQVAFQRANESNASSAVFALMQAEDNYHASWGKYATDSDLHYLSDCPAPTVVNGKTVIVPTTTAACEAISKNYTKTLSAFQYTLGVIATPGPDGTLGTSDDGYLITATPTNKQSGRVTFCANDQDGLLRGQVNGGTISTPATSAECDGYPEREAGVVPATAPAPQMYATTISNYATASKTTTESPSVTGLTLPAGTYVVTVNSAISKQAGEQALCTVKDSAGTLNVSIPAGGTANFAAGGSFVLQGMTTTGGNDHVTLTCNAAANFTWNGIGMTAIGTANSNYTWTMGPTMMTAMPVTNTNQ